MKTHAHLRRMIPPSLYGDLPENERGELERHLTDCETCRREMDQTRRLHLLLGRLPAVEPAPELLQQARTQFHAALDTETRPRRLLDRLADLLPAPPPPRPAFVIGSLLLVGLGFGLARLLGPSPQAEIGPGNLLASDAAYRITNVRFSEEQGNAGTIELTFDAVRPGRVRGRLEDPEIQKVLAYALVNGENAGVRIRAVSSVVSGGTAPPEREVKAALLLAMRTDQNDGVRREAMRALLRYPPDRELRDALLFVLLNDENPGLRVAAINGLDSLRARGYSPDAETIRTFRDRLTNDDNMYVRVKARSLIEEKKQ